MPNKALGLVGVKLGMSRLFDEADGTSYPVTVIKIEPNFVTQHRTKEKEGYAGIQITAGKQKQSRINKPMSGHYAKAQVEPGRGLWEFRIDEADESALLEKFNVGSEITLDLFKEGQYVDISGITKGKGFAGVIKRHHFAAQDNTHGNSLSHRAPGSIGQRQSPGRVFKNKKMAGHMGAKKRTIQNLKIIKIDPERKLIMVHGSIPGASGGLIVIKPSIKITQKDVA